MIHARQGCHIIIELSSNITCILELDSIITWHHVTTIIFVIVDPCILKM